MTVVSPAVVFGVIGLVRVVSPGVVAGSVTVVSPAVVVGSVTVVSPADVVGVEGSVTFVSSSVVIGVVGSVAVVSPAGVVGVGDSVRVVSPGLAVVVDGLVRVVSIAAVGIVGSVTVVSPTGIVDGSVEVVSPVVVVGWPPAALTGNIREAYEYNKRNTICNFILFFFCIASELCIQGDILGTVKIAVLDKDENQQNNMNTLMVRHEKMALKVKILHC